ncbi:hypothetical protein K402DRAFT_395738 [Aulographum hederae CBS 113979]|uniref:Uncharacterized protein n=1 Tax=Aulographum hederae CBS 113979 TaxID=1176131 RepID=A0A6G1GTY1_9PEZI|nr:hypothetical protein K402DRAFT_395738 [Aulographum hederae CBS 113979]
MSSSIAIPARKKKAVQLSGSSASSSNSSFASPSGTPKSPATPASESSTPERVWMHERRPSLLSSSISKCEHTVINVGLPDAPKLTACVKASQGFDWNLEMFLPSYHDRGSSDLERKQDPVVDIFLTDEEAAAMLPS